MAFKYIEELQINSSFTQRLALQPISSVMHIIFNLRNSENVI